MVIKKGFLAGMAALFLCGIGCNAPENGTALVSLKEELPGKWRAIGISIQVADSLATPKVLEIDEATLREKPILWEFTLDNHYRTTTNEAQSRGIWNAFSDTLMMIEPKTTYHYIVTFSGKEATFRALLDWDGDGVEDDTYVGMFVRDGARNSSE